MTSVLTTESPATDVGSWTRQYRRALESLGVETIGDLLHHYPRRYLDRSKVEKIGDIRMGHEATLVATVTAVNLARLPKKRTLVTVKVNDGTGTLPLTWFNQPWPAKKFKKDQEVLVSGKVGAFRGRFRMQNPTVEVLRGGDSDYVHTGRIVPIHPAGEGVSPGVIRKMVFDALQGVGPIEDPVPADIRGRHSLSELGSAIRNIHFPDDEGAERAARDRLKFDELFFLELGVAFRKHRVEAETEGIAHDTSGQLAERFVKSLPFEPTDAQRRAIDEVSADMAEPRPMNRLLQGEVGSGKTVVALYGCMVAVQSGHQAAIMAPTEVLAGQHLRTVEALLGPIGGHRVAGATPAGATDQGSLLGSGEEDGPSYAMLTASVTGKERQGVLEAVEAGRVDVLVGTHALVQESVEFANLSLAVVDEQHRFGLHQRIALKEKGASPDVLIMTATPIPRTLALTYYGDLDVSVIDEPS